jgi:regulator of RNase E activity RraB
MDNIEAFWHKFLDVRDQLNMEPVSEEAMVALLSHLQKVDSRLYYHLGTTSERVDLIISAEGHADLMPVLERLKTAAPNIESWSVVTTFEALLLFGRRNQYVFPLTENGDVLYRMASNGDDLSKSRNIDFATLFNRTSATEPFADYFRKLGYEVEIGKSRGMIRRKVDVIVTRNMLPTHDSITEFEKELQSVAEKFGGKNEGWGCYVHSNA